MASNVLRFLTGEPIEDYGPVRGPDPVVLQHLEDVYLAAVRARADRQYRADLRARGAAARAAKVRVRR